ncbi:MAG: hypothetical protein LBF60_09160 [Treponema sp.]|nr:hypothetical protein [Treponema sp.]
MEKTAGEEAPVRQNTGEPAGREGATNGKGAAGGGQARRRPCGGLRASEEKAKEWEEIAALQ